MSRKWRIAKKVPQDFQEQFPEINPLVLQLLYNRGLKKQEEIDEFLNPDYGQDLHDPFLFKDMRKAVDRILKALKKREKIVIYGDYDADGVCAASLLTSVLETFQGETPNVYIPHRETEGYGLRKEAIEELANKGVNLIITVDTGISNIEEIKLANQLGLEIIITDHHLPPPELPKAYAILNPQVKNEKYPFKNLAGVGVAFKLAQGLFSTSPFHDKDKVYEKWLLDLVAIGTVADLMPLLGENRTLVKYGLIVLNKTKRIGLQELIRIINNSSLSQLDSWNISYQIGPRLNAAGRIDHANKAFRLLTTKNQEEAEKIAQELNRTNQERQQIVERIVEEAKIQIGQPGEEEKILIIQNFSWPLGIIGLVGGKLVEEFYRPTLVITKKNERELVGSGRSIPEFNLVSALENVKEYLSRLGGHAQAAGFSLQSEGILDRFKKEMIKIARNQLGDLELNPFYFAEAEIKLEEINWTFYKILEEFAPFGQGNPRPKFITRDLIIMGLERVGLDEKHLRLLVRDEESKGKIEKMIYFGGGEWAEQLKMGDKIDCLFEVGTNQWNGQLELQIKIIDLKKVNNG